MSASSLHLAGSRDLLRRHGAVFGNAWRCRTKHLAHEAQLLPAAALMPRRPPHD